MTCEEVTAKYAMYKKAHEEAEQMSAANIDSMEGFMVAQYYLEMEKLTERRPECFEKSMQEQEEQEAPDISKGAQKVAQKLDKASGLATSVAPITSVEELEQILTNVIGRLNPQKVTDQELKVALKNMYTKAQKKELR